MTSDKRLYYKFSRLYKLLSRRIEKEVKKELGVTSVQLVTLFYLSKNDGCLLKDISKELDQNNSAVTTLAERMEKNGLLTKKISEADGRAFQAFLTDKGRKIVEKGLPMVHGFNQEIAASIQADDLEAVHRFLDTALEAFDSHSL